MSRKNVQKYINRELSWLEFNQRVLNEALDESNPVLERLKFLAISSSNLDEFFMVRVGGLHLERQAASTSREITGLTVEEQLDRIRERVEIMVQQQVELFHRLKELLAEGPDIVISHPADLDAKQGLAVDRFFEQEVFSSLSPVSIDERSFPLLANQTLNIGFRLAVGQDQHQPLLADELLFDERFLLISIGKRIPRILNVPSEHQMEFVFTEDVIRHLADRFFPKQTVIESFVFRVTRNADMRVDDEVASDLVESMEELLDERTTGGGVRLEVESSASDLAVEFLKKSLSLEERDVFRCDGPLAFSSLMPVSFANGFEEYRNEEWDSQPAAGIEPTEKVFSSIAESDQVLFHPYQTYNPVVRMLEEAAEDDDVLAIKQTLYRTSRSSRIISALQRAVESGKDVTVILELKARFDEARNISWAKQLEQSGANVIYGVKGLKTHAKATLIVRREQNGIVRYCHFGTGNYNEQTAKLYTDISLLTCDPDLGADAAEFFNAVTGYSRPQEFRRISMAPTSMRNRILEMIGIEIANAKNGRKALIRAKVNSLADQKVIEKLYEASQAGVEILLNVRGICCLRPQVKGLSKNIRVVSLIDRYLEHARILHFHHDGDDRVFISSADWMARNLDKRIELLVPVEEDPGRQKLMSVLDIYFKDNDKAYELDANGHYQKVRESKKSKRKLVNSQRRFFDLAVEEAIDHENRTPTVFKPHRKSSD